MAEMAKAPDSKSDELLSSVGSNPTASAKPFERIFCNSVTETLIRATEHAQHMKRVIVIYESNEDVDWPWGMFIEKDVSMGWLNFMMDTVKHWIFS